MSVCWQPMVRFRCEFPISYAHRSRKKPRNQDRGEITPSRLANTGETLTVPLSEEELQFDLRPEVDQTTIVAGVTVRDDILHVAELFQGGSHHTAARNQLLLK